MQQETEMPKRVRVRCSVEVTVTIPDDVDPEFYVEENGCPGTGLVGAELERIIEEGSKSGWCWACANGGKNEILSIESVP